MQMIADLHTHTLCATHAYNTFTEMAAAAKALGYCAGWIFRRASSKRRTGSWRPSTVPVCRGF